MTLQEWQERLANHFGTLRKSRPADSPIFALEHGISDTDFAQLKSTVHLAVKTHVFSDDTPLPWAVYAAEIGYQYSGDEYWVTFEANTPNWEGIGDRWWIRRCFEKFSDTYFGARPSGAWANHFSIICWPLTHAILPRDLQRQLARLLYELRNSFKPEHFESPTSLGELLAANSWNASSRFRCLLQMPSLVGQISTALLFHERDAAATLLFPATLKKIVTDLDRERTASIYLLNAKQKAQSFQFSGFKQGGGHTHKSTANEEKIQAAEALGIEPALFLQPSPDGTWKTFLEIPPLSPLLGRFPQFTTTLTEERCIISKSNLRPRSGGWLLCGIQKVELIAWPDWNEVLISFENAPQELANVLKTEHLLRPGPTWLFRVQKDGTAYEVKGKTVRPNKKYIVVSSTEQMGLSKYGKPIKLSCTGVYGVEITIPQFISSELAAALNSQGLTQACNIDVWPAGLPAAIWDNDGHAEWVYPDIPRLGIHLDHTAKTLTLNIDGIDESIEIPTTDDQSHYFLELPQLAPGSYQANIKATYPNSEKKSIEGRIELIIKEPLKATQQPAYLKSPLRVFLNPLKPTLEQIWRRDCQIEVFGPRDRKVSCVIDFLDHDKEKALFTSSFPLAKMPLTNDEWATAFDNHIESNSKTQEFHDLANTLRISFDAGELGRFSFLAEREFAPLRWVILKDKHTLRLADDSGITTKPNILHFPYNTPDKWVAKNIDPTKSKIEGDVDGGLYVASHGTQYCSVILPPKRPIVLSDLNRRPIFSYRTRNAAGLSELIRTTAAWSNATVPGSYIVNRWRTDIVEHFQKWLFYYMCGRAWGEAERANNPDKTTYLARLMGILAAFPNASRLATVLNRDNSIWAGLTVDRKIEKFADIIKREGEWRPSYSLRTNPLQDAETKKMQTAEWFAEFFLRLASAPETLPQFTGGSLSKAAEIALDENRYIICAARYLTISSTAQAYSLDDVTWPNKAWLWR